MAANYNKLWKILIDKKMKKKELCELAGISQASISKMARGGSITVEVLIKICSALGCTIDDIMDIVPEEK